MCLVTTQKEPIILKEDKVVYKVLQFYAGQLLAPYKHKEYSQGEVYTTEILFESDLPRPDYQEFDPIFKDYCADKVTKLLEAEELIYISQGFHAFTDLQLAILEAKAWAVANWRVGYAVMEATIPAGSEYWENILGECAASSIVITTKQFNEHGDVV